MRGILPGGPKQAPSASSSSESPRELERKVSGLADHSEKSVERKLSGSMQPGQSDAFVRPNFEWGKFDATAKKSCLNIRTTDKDAQAHCLKAMRLLLTQDPRFKKGEAPQFELKMITLTNGQAQIRIKQLNHPKPKHRICYGSQPEHKVSKSPDTRPHRVLHDYFDKLDVCGLKSSDIDEYLRNDEIMELFCSPDVFACPDRGQRILGVSAGSDAIAGKLAIYLINKGRVYLGCRLLHSRSVDHCLEAISLLKKQIDPEIRKMRDVLKISDVTSYACAVLCSKKNNDPFSAARLFTLDGPNWNEALGKFIEDQILQQLNPCSSRKDQEIIVDQMLPAGVPEFQEIRQKCEKELRREPFGDVAVVLYNWNNVDEESKEQAARNLAEFILVGGRKVQELTGYISHWEEWHDKIPTYQFPRSPETFKEMSDWLATIQSWVSNYDPIFAMNWLAHRGIETEGVGDHFSIRRNILSWDHARGLLALARAYALGTSFSFSVKRAIAVLKVLSHEAIEFSRVTKDPMPLEHLQELRDGVKKLLEEMGTLPDKAGRLKELRAGLAALQLFNHLAD